MEMVCPICGRNEFSATKVLWPELVVEWQLSVEEEAYIDRQQGYHCANCGGNLRSMALAEAITTAYGYKGTLNGFCSSPDKADLRVLEINQAGTLTKHLQHLPSHRLISYPEYDMTKLAIDTESFDLVIHSDTLEHVNYPETAMKECCRILKRSGSCIFTVPIVVGRFSRSRTGLRKSYHGCANDAASDLLVHTEFGADIWKMVLSAGFKSCTVHCLEYPAGLAIVAKR